MTDATGCRKCVECANSDHHWIDDQLSEDSYWPFFSCKHCDAIGQECPRCHDDEERSQTCLACGGDGVVVARMYRVEGWERPVFVAASSEAEAVESAETMLDFAASQLTAKVAEAVGRCEGCTRLVYEGEDCEDAPDGPGKWCPDCRNSDGDEFEAEDMED